MIEIGVFTGHGTLAFAQSVPEDGKVFGLDITEEYPSIGKEFWKKAGVEEKINLMIGPATESLEKLLREEGRTFDFAFIDADKLNCMKASFSFSIHFQTPIFPNKKTQLITSSQRSLSGKVE